MDQRGIALYQNDFLHRPISARPFWSKLTNESPSATSHAHIGRQVCRVGHNFSHNFSLHSPKLPETSFTTAKTSPPTTTLRKHKETIQRQNDHFIQFRSQPRPRNLHHVPFLQYLRPFKPPFNVQNVEQEPLLRNVSAKTAIKQP